MSCAPFPTVRRVFYAYVFGVVSVSGGDEDSDDDDNYFTPPRRPNRPTERQRAAERAGQVIQQFSIVCVCVASGRVSKSWIVRSFRLRTQERHCSVSPLLLQCVCSVYECVFFSAVELPSTHRVCILYIILVCVSGTPCFTA